MKLIHCADLHLDSKMESIMPTDLAKIRKVEILDTFRRMIDYAYINNINIIMICGDMFDSSKIQNKTKEYIIELISEHPDIDFIYLCGNHDENNFIKTLEIVPSNIKTFTDNWTSYRYGNLVITGCELNNINNQADIINLKALENKNIDYLALGHIHSYKTKRLDARGKYAYSGCLEGRGFDECGDKGFVEVEINNNKISTSFIKFSKRTLHEVSVDISGKETLRTIEKAITDVIDPIDPDDLVKVNLVGTYTTNTKKDMIRFNQLLENKFFFGRVKDKTTIKIDIDEYKNDVSLLGEFIRTTLNSDEDKSIQGEIITLGLRALRGEDLE